MAKVQPIRPDVPARAIHPLADIFPMLPPDELHDLAEDIRLNGQAQPVLVDREGRVLDGRNRLAACEIAGVEPAIEIWEGAEEDVGALILSLNVSRRHLNAGQRAMAVAMVFPEPEKGGRGKKVNSLETKEFSPARLSQARTVLAYSRDLAWQVLANIKRIDAAYQEAKTARDSGLDGEEKLNWLRREAPDLAELVDEEKLTLAEAVAAAQRRAEEKRDKARLRTKMLHDTLSKLFAFDSDFAASIDPTYWPEPDVALASFARTDFERAIATLQQTRDALFQGE